MSETFDLGHGDPRTRLVEELRRQVGGWEGSALQNEADFSSGTPALDQLLGGPLRYGMLVEWLGGLAYSGAATLSLLAAREACRPGGALVVIDRLQTFYPPAAAAWGIDLSRLIIVRPRGPRDALWAAIQSLRSPAVAAVWAPLDRLTSREFRQLQLAAQAGRTLGLLLRPAHVRGQPSWSDVQLWISPWSVARRQSHSNHRPTQSDRARYLQVRILRQRRARPGGSIVLNINDADHTIEAVSRSMALGSPLANRQKHKTDQQELHHDAFPLHLVSELAHSKTRSLPARA